MATATERAVGALQRHRCAKHPNGLKVSVYPGWATRNAGQGFDPRGILFHHDATGKGPSPAVKRYMWETAAIKPACQFWVDYYGNWVAGSNGRANHAGLGSGVGPFPANQANYYAFGVETDHTVDEPWSQDQYDGIACGFAAINQEFRWNPHTSNWGHKDYAPARKIDPAGINMRKFQDDVLARMSTAPPKPTTPQLPPKDEVTMFMVANSEKPAPWLLINGRSVTQVKPGENQVLGKCGVKVYKLKTAEITDLLEAVRR